MGIFEIIFYAIFLAKSTPTITVESHKKNESSWHRKHSSLLQYNKNYNSLQYSNNYSYVQYSNKFTLLQHGNS